MIFFSYKNYSYSKFFILKAKKRSFETTKLKKIQIDPVTPLFE